VGALSLRLQSDSSAQRTANFLSGSNRIILVCSGARRTSRMNRIEVSARHDSTTHHSESSALHRTYLAAGRIVCAERGVQVSVSSPYPACALGGRASGVTTVSLPRPMGCPFRGRGPRTGEYTRAHRSSQSKTDRVAFKTWRFLAACPRQSSSRPPASAPSRSKSGSSPAEYTSATIYSRSNITPSPDPQIDRRSNVLPRRKSGAMLDRPPFADCEPLRCCLVGRCARYL